MQGGASAYQVPWGQYQWHYQALITHMAEQPAFRLVRDWGSCIQLMIPALLCIFNYLELR